MSRPNFLRRFLRRVTLTEGEQSILLAFFGVAFFGAALALNIVMTLGGQEIMQRSFSAYDYWIVLSGALGGCLGLLWGVTGWGIQDCAGRHSRLSAQSGSAFSADHCTAILRHDVWAIHAVCVVV